MSEAAQESPFSEEQQRALSCVLDQIIPPSADTKMPGAGEIGLVEYIERALQTAPALQPTIADGLATAASADGGLAEAVNVHAGKVTNQAVAESLGMACEEFAPRAG